VRQLDNCNRKKQQPTNGCFPSGSHGTSEASLKKPYQILLNHGRQKKPNYSGTVEEARIPGNAPEYQKT
jgi:hypothetical protein